MEDLGPWDGDRATLDPVTSATPVKAAAKLALATGSSCRQRRGYRTATTTCAPPRATRCAGQQAVHDASATPSRSPTTGVVDAAAAVADDLPDDVAWVPANSTGNGLLADLASPGSGVHLKGGGQ
jgi:NADH-quinone oxidoreductase subunit G